MEESNNLSYNRPNSFLKAIRFPVLLYFWLHTKKKKDETFAGVVIRLLEGSRKRDR